MTPDLRDLYQEMILDHNKRPRNFGVPERAGRKAEGFNPLCGDRVTLYVDLDGERLREIRFQGSGCAISTASASMLTEALKGKTREEADILFRSFQDLVTGKGEKGDLGKLSVFAGVGEFPARVKCAILAWHTLKAALENRPEPVSTE